MHKCLLFLLLAVAPTALAQSSGKWLGTWAASPMRLEDDRAAKLAIGTREMTLRQVVHISQGGKSMRVVLSNEFGDAPLTVSAAHVAFLSSGSKILPATDHVLTFVGHPDATVAPGHFLASDPVTLVLPIFSDLVISLDLPVQTLNGITVHTDALTTSYIAGGDQTAALEFVSPGVAPPGLASPDLDAPVQGSTSIPGTDKPIVKPTRPGTDSSTATGPAGPVLQTTSWYFLKGIEVNAEKKSGAIVLFGDSITDGARSTPETNRRYPDALAPLLAANKKTSRLAVLNQGIGGNRVLQDGYGPKALDRFERDVLQQPGVQYVVLLEGINDIGRTDKPEKPEDPVTAQQLIDALTQLAGRAHARGLKVFGATLTPFVGAGYAAPEGEAMRQAVNAFVCSSKVFDGVADFDKATRDPTDPSRLLPKYDSGDHLHPDDAGYAAMATAVNLKLFRRK